MLLSFLDFEDIGRFSVLSVASCQIYAFCLIDFRCLSISLLFIIIVISASFHITLVEISGGGWLCQWAKRAGLCNAGWDCRLEASTRTGVSDDKVLHTMARDP